MVHSALKSRSPVRVIGLLLQQGIERRLAIFCTTGWIGLTGSAARATKGIASRARAYTGHLRLRVRFTLPPSPEAQPAGQSPKLNGYQNATLRGSNDLIFYVSRCESTWVLVRPRLAFGPTPSWQPDPVLATPSWHRGVAARYYGAPLRPMACPFTRGSPESPASLPQVPLCNPVGFRQWSFVTSSPGGNALKPNVLVCFDIYSV
ncbi:MAG: hypothetical protein ACI97B_004291 [Verrucomicrobiales bacterium]|jgi:hypothetical protein